MRGAILAFVFGAWCLQQAPRLPDAGWGLALLLPLALVFVLRHGRGRTARFVGRAALLLAAGGLGVAWAALVAAQRLADALPPAWEGRDIRLVGVVASMPQPGERGERITFAIEQVLTPGAQLPARILLTRYYAGYGEAVTDRSSWFRAGERWQLTVRLKRPHGNYNPHGFDYELWALERNLRAVGYVREAGDNLRLAPMVLRPAYAVERLRETVRERFRAVLGEARYGGVLQALAIGDDDAIRDEDWETFRRTGIVHLVSISGLHVTMVGALAYALVFAGWRRGGRLALRLPAHKAATLAGVLAAGAYALLAGFAVPTQRTLYMLAVLALALWSGRSLALSRVLCWALLLVVLLDPWAVTAPGFWLSFGAVALLGYVGGNRLQRQGWLREAAQAQWAVTLGLAPMLLALFQQVSVISPLANALAIPLVSLVITPLVLAGVVLPLEGLWLFAHMLLGWGMSALQAASGLPLAVWQQHAPPAWTVLAALAGVLWLLLPRGFPARWLGACALLPLFLLAPPAPGRGELRVAVLDVGQGQAVLLQTARHALLYDAGPRYSDVADSGSRVILPYLRATGITRLDGLILSHDDTDHTGGAAAVLRAGEVGWMASSLAAAHPLQDLAARRMPCFAGQSWNWDGVRFDMLHPAAASVAKAGIKDNQRSCVLRVASAHGSLLLTGDIERAAERELLQRAPGLLAADVLLVPHHGSRSSSSPGFVAAVDPRIAIFTVGYRNSYGHPKPAVEQRYLDAGSRLYRSDRDGALLLHFAPGGVRAEAWRTQRPRYWHETPARVAENGGAG